MKKRGQTDSRPELEHRGGQPRTPRVPSTAAMIHYLLTHGQDARAGTEEIGPSKLGSELAMPYATATAGLRRLEKEGVIRRTYLVNPFRTAFCFEYIVGFQFDGAFVRQSPDTEHKKVERLITNILERLQHKDMHAISRHIIITNARILQGDPDREIELTVLSNDGGYSIGCWVRDVLSATPGVRHLRTLTVSWNCAWNGYSGRYHNGDHASHDEQG